MNKKALLVLNGEVCPLPNLDNYDGVFASDGGSKYLDGSLITAIIGDKDSDKLHSARENYISRPDQNYTDFDKSLMYLIEQGYTHVDVYCVGGGEQDHFLGNLNTAYRFKNQLVLSLYDLNYEIFLCESQCELLGETGRKVSLYPYSTANVTSAGLVYELENTALDTRSLISIRNEITSTKAMITVHSGTLFIFKAR